MECKFKQNTLLDAYGMELIDTLWNVNIKIDVWLAETASAN